MIFRKFSLNLISLNYLSQGNATKSIGFVNVIIVFLIIPIGFAISFIILMAENQCRNRKNIENTEDEEQAKPNNRLCNCICHQQQPRRS